jgi:thioredoxin 2
MAGKAVVLKVDTDKHPQLAQRFGVQGIPNFPVMKDGQAVRQQPGYVPHTQLTSWLSEAVGAPRRPDRRYSFARAFSMPGEFHRM